MIFANGSTESSRGIYRPADLATWPFDSLRPDVGRLQLRPPRDLAGKLLQTLADTFDREGALRLEAEMRRTLCPRKVADLLRREADACDLLEACGRFIRATGAYESPSQSAYGFMTALESMWPDARDRLVDVFFRLPPTELLGCRAEAFHFVVRACGSRLQRYVAEVVTDVTSLEQYCSTGAGASVMWQLAFVGAFPPKLLQAVSRPDVFFWRLSFSSRRCDDDGEWCVSLALPVWSLLDGEARARLAGAYRDEGRLLERMRCDFASRVVVERCILKELYR